MNEKIIEDIFGIIFEQQESLNSIERGVKNNDLALIFLRIELLRSYQEDLKKMVGSIIESKKKEEV